MASYTVIGGDHQEYGPVSREEVVTWIDEGRLSGQSLARGESDPQWRALSTFPEFAEALREQAARFLQVNPTLDPMALRFKDESFSVGRCLSRSGELLKDNLGLLFACAALVWLLGLVSQFLPVIGGFVYLLLDGVLFGGLFVVFLRRIRGQAAAVGDVFTGFGPGFQQLVLAGAVTSVLAWFGLFFCILPWVYLTVAWVFAVPLVADRNLQFWSAMELSRRSVNRVFGQMLLLMLLAFLPTIVSFVFAQVRIFAVAYPGFQELAGTGQADMNQWMEFFTTVARAGMPLVMMNKLVLLINLPFAVGALMYAYEDLFSGGPRE